MSAEREGNLPSECYGLAEVGAQTSGRQDLLHGTRSARRLRHLLSSIAAAWLVFGTVNLSAQDTPEMLAAMRAVLVPIPDQVPAFHALAPELRQQIPPIRIQGHRWHGDPAQRFVQIDGRRITEDGVAGQNLWLRQIRVDSVVMQYRDYLFIHPL